MDKVLALAARLRASGLGIQHLDLGGGLGIAYHSGQKAPAIQAFIESLHTRLRQSGLAAMVEPGRSIVGAAGSLLTRVLYRKRNGYWRTLYIGGGSHEHLWVDGYRGGNDFCRFGRKRINNGRGCARKES